MFRSENRATAATLVDRNGGVLDEELVAFWAPDEPQAVRFHGHRFPSLACVRAWEARMQALESDGTNPSFPFGASSPRARRHDPAQEVFAPGCWTWSCSPLPPSLDSIHTDQSVGLPAAWSRLLVLAGWSLTGCEREEGRRIEGGTEKESPSPAATEMGGEGRGRGDERNGTACRAPGAGRGRGGGGGWDKTNVAAQGRSFAVRRAPSPVSPLTG